MALTWLHVSDFHLSDGAPYDQVVILRALIESVKRFRGEGHLPELIFATGDIAENGKAKEYESATKFFDDLLSAAGLNRDRLFVIPGNHDVDRKAGKFLPRTLDTREDADEYFDPDTPTNHLTQKFHAFSAWYNDYFKTIRSFPTTTTCSPVEIVTINNCRLAILPLNSALFCIDDHDHEKLFIGRRCFDAAKKQLSAADLTIALMHHPLDWLSPLEQANIETAFEESVDFLLQGHFHQTAAKGIVTANGGYLKLAAGASYQTRKWPNSAMYVTCDGNQVAIFPIRYEDSPREVWTHDTSLFPSPSYIGSFPFQGCPDSASPPTAVDGTTAFKKNTPQPTNSLNSPLVRIVKILVASPGDVAEERKIVVEMILDWNARHAQSPIRLEAVVWEKYAAPENRGDGKGPQAPINRHLVESCHFAIGIFWTRIGTPTKVAPGGAVEEIERMLEKKKPVMLYFSSAPVPRNTFEGEQIAQVDKFRAAMQSDGLVWNYGSPSELRSLLVTHLDFNVSRWFPFHEGEGVLESGLQFQALCRYQSALKEELGYIRMLGLPGVECVKVNLDDATFVPLRLTDRQEMFSARLEKDSGKRHEGGDHILYPDDIMKRAFHDWRHRRMLLVIGDPGAGKTTLLKYYALCALDSERFSRLGFSGPVNVFYLPLRELVCHENGRYHSLPANLALWSERNHLPFTEQQFDQWLQSGRALVLLDGLDEISNTDERKEVCRWIDAAWKSFPGLRFVVTSRATGYRQEEGVELAADFERADVQDFTVDQQELFLLQWFTAAFLKEPPDMGVDEATWLAKQQAKAEERTRTIAKHLKEEKNKGLRQLAAIPMILQIMAILWKDRDYMPESRVKLYEAAIDYLLEFRDKRRGIIPLVSAVRARKVLGPVSLWMQEELKKDEADKEMMQAIMKERLEILDNPPSVDAFCNYLVERAGLLVECSRGKAYLFRHKSLREYLAGVQLAKKVNRNPDSLDTLVAGFGDDWWEEPIKFFIAQEDEEIFDLFMQKLFDSAVSEELTPKKQLLLQTMIEEAPEKKVDALCKKLLAFETTAGRQRVILDCLKTIAKPSALPALEQFRAQEFAKRGTANTDVFDRAEEVIIALGGKALERATEKSISGKPLSIRNSNEQNAEYILIPGGNYWYSAMKKAVDVADCYVAKYPVTNKLYRSFIAWLEGKDSVKNHALVFRIELERIAESNDWGPGFADYLKGGEDDLAALFRSENDEDRKFGGDDQPVVGVTWYASQAYCLWLSMIDNAKQYRLANEIEWEWAAGGKQGTTGQKVREYPWLEERGGASPGLLNFWESNIGATTSVGSYPDGATPEGLYDMAGNVWEWCSDWYGDDGTFSNPLGPETGSNRVIRGGSWGSGAGSCRSANRGGLPPGDRSSNVGFRPVFVP